MPRNLNHKNHMRRLWQQKNGALDATLHKQTVDSSQKNKRGSLTVRSFWKIQKYSLELTSSSSWRQRVPREKAAEWSGRSRLPVLHDLLDKAEVQLNDARKPTAPFVKECN